MNDKDITWKEFRKGIWCAVSFGYDWNIAHDAAINDGKISKEIQFIEIYNPMPTGDHWKLIEWARNLRDRGSRSLLKIPIHKRDFVKRASKALDEGPFRGFCMEVKGAACRDYRDKNDLRMERGHVYVFVGTVEKENA